MPAADAAAAAAADAGAPDLGRLQLRDNSGAGLAAESTQPVYLRKGCRGQAITALVHIPAGEEQPPGHLGYLWFYLSRPLFGGASSLYQLDLSTKEELELEDARKGPDVSCMCYDDVNHVVWTGHRDGGIRAWSAAKGQPLTDLHPAFRSPVSAITTDERGCCWAGSSAPMEGHQTAVGGLCRAAMLGGHAHPLTGSVSVHHRSTKHNRVAQACQPAGGFHSTCTCCEAENVRHLSRLPACTDKGKVRCFEVQPAGTDGVKMCYRVVKLGELRTISDGVCFDFSNVEVVNGMLVHRDLREPAHYGPVRSIAAAVGRVWTCGGSSAFASFKEWTQMGVLLGSQSMRRTGLANDMVLVSQVVGVQENQRVSVNAPEWCESGTTVDQLMYVDMPWQLLTVHDSGAIQVWGVVDKTMQPLACIGDRVAPALRLVVSEPLGLLITAHNDGKLRLRALPHPRGPEAIQVVYQAKAADQVQKFADGALPCAHIDSQANLGQAVGCTLLGGVIAASKNAGLEQLPTAELRRVVQEHSAQHGGRQFKLLPADPDKGQVPFWRLTPNSLSVYLEDIKREMELADTGCLACRREEH